MTRYQTDTEVQRPAGSIVYAREGIAIVRGCGFGTESQFLEWVGPYPLGGDVSLCSEADAHSYLKTNGEFYRCGALRAVGVMR